MNSDSVNIKGGGRGTEDGLKKRKMTCNEEDYPCKYSRTPPKKPKSVRAKSNPEEFSKLPHFWAKFSGAKSEDQGSI